MHALPVSPSPQPPRVPHVGAAAPPARAEADHRGGFAATLQRAGQAGAAAQADADGARNTAGTGQDAAAPLPGADPAVADGAVPPDAVAADPTAGQAGAAAEAAQRRAVGANPPALGGRPRSIRPADEAEAAADATAKPSPEPAILDAAVALAAAQPNSVPPAAMPVGGAGEPSAAKGLAEGGIPGGSPGDALRPLGPPGGAAAVGRAANASGIPPSTDIDAGGFARNGAATPVPGAEGRDPKAGDPKGGELKGWDAAGLDADGSDLAGFSPAGPDLAGLDPSRHVPGTADPAGAAPDGEARRADRAAPNAGLPEPAPGGPPSNGFARGDALRSTDRASLAPPAGRPATGESNAASPHPSAAPAGTPTRGAAPARPGRPVTSGADGAGAAAEAASSAQDLVAEAARGTAAAATAVNAPLDSPPPANTAPVIVSAVAVGAPAPPPPGGAHGGPGRVVGRQGHGSATEAAAELSELKATTSAASEAALPARLANPPAEATSGLGAAIPAASLEAAAAPSPADPAPPNGIAPPIATAAPHAAAPLPAPRPAPVAPPVVPVQQLAPLAITLALGPGQVPHLTVALEPEALGKVQIRIERNAAGTTTAVRVTAERPETLALLLRDAPQLDRALGQAGVAVPDGALSFALANGDQSAGQRAAGERQPGGRRGPGGGSRLAEPGAPGEAATSVASLSLLDIAV